jgi:hypothetical protein
MKKSVLLYYLYYINRSCHASIYHGAAELQISFTAENLAAIHRCTCCKQVLVSAMDVEIKGAHSEDNYRKADKIIFLNN